MREIPTSAMKIQEGLFAAQNTFTVSNKSYTFYDIYSVEGYCFWEKNQPENYDEEGNLKPLNERVYAQYARTAYKTIEELNENFVSIPIEEGFEII